MKPYYKSWKTSKHNFVKCVDCHYSPETQKHIWGKFQAMSQVVKYITRTYGTKPYAEIEDASCLREGCHSKRLMEGKIVTPGGVKFDHGPHLLDLKRGKQLKCTTCHSQIVQGNHLEVTESVCFICHFKPTVKGGPRPATAECTVCHEIPSKDFDFQNIKFNHQDFAGHRGLSCEKCHLEAVSGDGEANKERCYECHNDPERLEKFPDTTFMHSKHVTEHKVECYKCHQEIKHSVRTSIKPLDYDCSSCHMGEHKAQKDLYMGQGGKGVAAMPAPMFLANVDCTGCHLVPEVAKEKAVFTGQTLKTEEISCVTCHGKDYLGILKSWKENINSQLKTIEPKIITAQNLLKKSKKGTKEYQKGFKLLQDAKHNFDFVKYARGVHNIDYANALLEKSLQNINQIHQLLK